jgi:molybdopterin synthase catalytic subunit
MRIRVKLFAILRERAGVGELALDASEGATVGAAVSILIQRVPALEQYARRAAYAVNCEYVGAGTILKDGDELALIPPVSGG